MFLLLFGQPLASLARDWWQDPDAGHGLLLAPLALWLAWRTGVRRESSPQPWLGVGMLVAAVLVRYLSGLAVELFTMRASIVLAAAGLVVFSLGWRQLLAWWLPFLLIALSIPLPAVVVNTLALPLQLRASSWGAALLQFRHVPAALSGNIIKLPGRDLFVTEACSGLHSLTALLSLGVVAGGLWLQRPVSRIVLVLVAIPVAMVVNAFRVFLTGFLVYYISPQLGEGFMHLSEGWLLFVVAFVFLGGLTWLVSTLERLAPRRPADD
jgi:exosortase